MKAKDDEDEDTNEQLEAQIEVAEGQFERLRRVGEVEAGLRELKFFLQESRQEDVWLAVRHLLAIGVEMVERLVFLKRRSLELQSERLENPRTERA